MKVSQRLIAYLWLKIVSVFLPLALSVAANELLGMISGRLEDLLTVTTKATLHRAAPGPNATCSFCSEL